MIPTNSLEIEYSFDQPHLVGTMPPFSYAKFDDPEDEDKMPFEEYPLNHVTSDICSWQKFLI